MSVALTKNSGIDYLIRDVGQKIMPEDAGWGKMLLHDKMLFEKDFTIREVTLATLDVLKERIGKELAIIAKAEEENSAAPIFKAELVKEKASKRIALLNLKNEKVALSSYAALAQTLTYRYKNVEYKQEGVLGSIYYRRLK